MVRETFVGIDGGGTRARAVVTDGRGVELARVEAEAGLVLAGDPAAGAPALGALVMRALAAAGAERPAAVLCCALAGAGREEQARPLAAALERLAVARRVRVATDAEAAFHDAFRDGPGILLIAGTGSIAWGRGEDGRTARVGGWGHLLGDEGSGYALGLGALRAAVRAHDGRGPETRLLRQILEHTGLHAPEALIAWAATASKAAIAALAPLVASAAAEGDAVACALVDEAARELAGHAAALHRRLGPWSVPPPIALAGGLLAPGRPLRPAVVAALGLTGAPCRVLDDAVDAARGAAALARGS